MSQERGQANWPHVLVAHLALIVGPSFAFPAAAEVPALGSTVRGPLDLAGKQIVLPDGEWTVAGHGYDQVVGLDDVPYGAIENVVLFRLAGNG